MSDVLLVLVTLVFFGLCVLYVHALDRMIRKDDVDDPATEPVQETVR